MDRQATTDPDADRTPTPRRVSTTARLEREATAARVMRLRAANVPHSLIADELGVSVTTVHRIVNAEVRKQREAVALEKLVKRHERGVQLETLDTLMNPVLSLSPVDPAKLTAAGLQFRDWLAAVEVSRKVKADHTALFGLAAPGGAAGARDVDVPVDFLTEAAEARAVMKWVDGFKYTDPDVHEILIGRMADSRLKAIGAEHDQFPDPYADPAADAPRVVESEAGDGGGPGLDPVADAAGEVGGAGPAEPADAGPGEAGVPRGG